MERFNERKTNRFIFIGNGKCKRTIESCESTEQLDIAVDMCNSFGKTVCSILNSSDLGWLSSKLNIHRMWCKRSYSVLNSSLSELDSEVSKRREYIETHHLDASVVGFK